ncbi:MAG: winged helix-turn-helix domain-containing protein [Proteobacteria bacterium]|nr:winged helix-turn-helix domain-containing protein [Pseudomonadota bacterium]
MVINIDSNNTNEIYSFLDFHVNPQQRSVTQDVTQSTQVIDLSKKSFDMLVVLLQRHGELITKDELLAAVWPNQIITDSALSKQIARLRGIFDSQESESFIETIRGVGIRLIVDVQVTGDQQDNLTSKTLFIKHLITAGVLLAVGFFFFQFFTGSNLVVGSVTDPTTNSTANQIPKVKSIDESIIANRKSINIAIIPEQKTDEWLDIGGLNYVSELLQNHDEIETISPNIAWFNQDKSNVLALQLSQADNIDYVLVINIIKQQRRFIANIILRNKHGILATGDLQATTLSNLFEKLDSWAILQLNITSGVVFANSGHSAHISDFSLESYLRGLAAARSRDFNKAAQFLQTAVNQNESFFSAWLLLAEVEAELGNFQKALAITETIGKMDNFDNYYLNDLYNVKARVLIYLNKLDGAQVYLDKSIAISEQTGDMKAIIVSLSSQAMIQDRTGITEETLKIISKQLELVKRYNPLPNLIAQLNHNLAIVYQKLFRYDEAKHHVDLAIKQYYTLQNYSGLVSSYRVKANIHNDLAETGLALLALKKAEKWLNKVDSPIVLANYYVSKAMNLYEQGYLSQAYIEIDKLYDLSITYDNIEAKIMALIIQAELQLYYKNLTDARQSIAHVLDIVMFNPAQ